MAENKVYDMQIFCPYNTYPAPNLKVSKVMAWLDTAPKLFCIRQKIS